MIDSAIAIFLGVLLVELARFGGHVSANPPAGPDQARAYTLRFRIYALIACLLVVAQGVRIYLASRESEEAQTKLNASITSLGVRLTVSDTGRQVDNAYLKAKLEDYKELQALAPALLKMGEATEEYTKKQYETKTLSDAKLLDLTTDVISRLHKIGTDCKKGEDEVFGFEPPRPANWPQMTEAERTPYYVQRNQEIQRRYMNAELSCDSAFKQSVRGDAFYVENELLKRTGGDSFMSMNQQHEASIFFGVQANGPSVNDATDYLEALQSKFKEMTLATHK